MFRKLLLRSLFFILLFAVLGEVALRFTGQAPWNPPQRKLEVVEPGGHFFKKDPLLGYSMQAGKLKVRMDGTHEFDASHGKDLYRLTSYAPDTADRPEIWIFGCSFTYGWGVNDSENYPWYLQEMLPDYTIRNYGVSGYGTYQNLLEFERQLSQGKKPALVVLAYGSFHEQRNTCNRFWRKAIASQEVIQGLEYPWVRFGENEELVRGKMPLSYSPFPLMRLSALSHFLEVQYCHYEDKGLRSQEVSWRLIQEFQQKCQAGNTPFLLAGIWKNPASDLMLQKAADQGYSQVDISEDLQDPAFRIMENDAHPNGIIHQRYAKSLFPLIQQLLH